jgi:hypothetical protein
MSLRTHPNIKHHVLTQRVAVIPIMLAAISSVAGCGRMASSLDRQQLVVDLSPNATAAMSIHIRAVCSHVKNTPPLPLPKQHSEINIMYGVEFDTTNSSPAELAQLQICLSRFKHVVLGFDQENAGDEGSLSRQPLAIRDR